MFETEHRRKEIGIRRVHGATVQQILAMFNSRFVKIVLVCFVVAVPVSIVIMRRYLEGFAYQVPLHVCIYGKKVLDRIKIENQRFRFLFRNNLNINDGFLLPAW